VVVTFETKGEEQKVEADYVFVMVGRRPNTDEMGLEQVGVKLTERGLIEIDKQCRTNLSNIYAIGDVVEGPQLAHKASYEAKIAAEAIAGHTSEIDYLGIPAVVFSDPELASVGYTESQAKEEGIAVIAAKFPFAANGRALSLDSGDGFLKLITRKDDGVVIGAQIAGTSASDMIAELGLAIEAGMTAEDLAMTIHAHPTLGEITMEAAEVALGSPIHIMK
jgi:dihydrolipoamide dehydrogenase